jgi:hypothetical protein
MNTVEKLPTKKVGIPSCYHRSIQNSQISSIMPPINTVIPELHPLLVEKMAVL